MKLLLVILFSAALVWGQAAPPICAQMASAPAASSACCCSDCGNTCCCLNKSAPNPKPAPAAPAPRVAQSDHLLLPAPAAVVFVLPPLAGLSTAHLLSSPSHAAALPLYQQNCAFLI